MGFADVYTIVTRESGADPNVTSGAATETLFWYFGKHAGRQGTSPLWSVLGLVPVLAGLVMMVM